MSLPLAGTRVLDLTNVIAGPLASYLLALMGAEVIKVEVPGIGDLSRKMGADPAMGRQQMGASYLAFNAGKKSITLNLKSERGKDLFRKLCLDADVVLENFRPGAMQRLGLSAEDLRALNPRLIYCAVSGFGQTGPLAQRASYDQIIQGYCGLMALTGEPDTAPVKAGLVVCDTTAAITAAFAVASALVKRNATGEGEIIDVSMLDCALASMSSWVISNYLNAGYAAQPVGNHSQTSAPSGTFRTGDGVINIVNNEQKQFQATCDALGLGELKTDPRFAERDDRMRNQAELQAILEASLAEADAANGSSVWPTRGCRSGPCCRCRRLPSMRSCASAGSCRRCTCRRWIAMCRSWGWDSNLAASRCRSHCRRRRWASIPTTCSATWAVPMGRSPPCAKRASCR